MAGDRGVVRGKGKTANGKVSMESDEKVCPFCAETIKAAAVVCKHCGRDINAPETTLPQPDVVKIGEKLCHFCSKTIATNATYCKHCGKSLGVGDNEKQCRYCREPVQKDAKVCKHCGKKLVKGFFDGCGTLIIIIVCALVAMKIMGCL